MQKVKQGAMLCLLITMFALGLLPGGWTVFAQVADATATLSPSPARGDHVTPVQTRTPDITPSVAPVPCASPALSTEEQKTRAANRAALAKKIRSYVKNDVAWQKARVGLYFALVDNGQVVYEKNPNLPMIPASNLKVVTTSSALALMGPDYRFHTTIWGGEIDKATGEMSGNLYLEGTGDPTFMDPFTNNPTKTFHRFAAHLRKLGVRSISGDLIGDDSAYDREFLGRGWKPRYLMYDYAAPAGALSINGNCVRLIMQKGRASMQPGNRYVQVITTSRSRGRLRVSRKPGTDVVKVSGSDPGTSYRNLTINNPSMYTTAVFARVLEGHGIKIKGKVRLIDAETDVDYQKGTKAIAYHRSQPLYKIVNQINKESDNVCAQHLFKAIGHQVKGKGTCDLSNEAVVQFLKSAGIDASCFAMADGSGLSVYNRITPRQMAELLRYMKGHKYWKYFWKSLPVAGVDGTLQYRMKGCPVHAKTGGLQGHIALSGYVTTRAGQQLVFAMFTNRHHHWGDRIRQNEDYLLKMISNWNCKL